MHKAWPKLKKQLWQYGETGDEVRQMVFNRLTNATYHQLSQADAEDCLAQCEADDDPPLVQYEETVEERDAYRFWKCNGTKTFTDHKGQSGK